MEQQIGDLIVRFGLPTVALIIVVWTGRKRLWVWGRELDYREALLQKALAEAEEWKTMALGLLGHVERQGTSEANKPAPSRKDG